MKKISIPFSLSSIRLRSLSLSKGRSVEGSSAFLASSSWSRKATGSRAFLAALSLVSCLSPLVLFTACGESTTTEKIVEVATGGTEIVSSVKDLPKCTKDNQGEQALVKGETSVRVCVDGKWFATVSKSEKDTVFVAGDTVYLEKGDFSCTTKQLKDKSGLKIICNGDSVGVVLNGEKGNKGDKGDSGASCSIAEQTDSTVTIQCGEKSIDLKLGNSAGTGDADTLELDSEKIAVSLDSLSGFSQKGPFLKGSIVYLYELSDGRTLKQTNGNFTSEITSNDGRYTFQSRNLVSQYALLIVDGKFRNETTGENSATAIKLQAYTNMLSRRSANVNLLTHLEKDRVFYLVTQEKKTLRAAKRQAQAEILSQFYFDTTDFKVESEDLDVFGKTDADAALLAISILLQGGHDEAELSMLLTDISKDLEKDGLWNEEEAAATKVKIADWLFTKNWPAFRENVEKWELDNGQGVGNFEKFLETFMVGAYGLEPCGAEDDGKRDTINNSLSIQNGVTLYCHDGLWYQELPKTYLNPDINYGEMFDLRYRIMYKTVTIGGLTWLAQNVYSEVEGSYCYNNAKVCAGTGRLYTRSAAFKACPKGWIVPGVWGNKSDWSALVDAAGGESVAGKKLKSKVGWPYSEAAGTDDYGFSAPDSRSMDAKGNFCTDCDTYFWGDVYSLDLSNFFEEPYASRAKLVDTRHSDNALSVRCVLHEDSNGQ